MPSKTKTTNIIIVTIGVVVAISIIIAPVIFQRKYLEGPRTIHYEISLTPDDNSTYRFIAPIPVLSSRGTQISSKDDGEPIQLLNELRFLEGNGLYRIVEDSNLTGKYGLEIQGSGKIKLEVHKTFAVGDPGRSKNYFARLSGNQTFLDTSSSISVYIECYGRSGLDEDAFLLNWTTVYPGWNFVNIEHTRVIVD